MNLPARFRRLAERLSRNVVLRRRLPRRFGALRLHISPGASLVYWRGLRQSVFADLYDFAETYVKPGHTVWDVGANIGLFSFSAASRAGPAGHVLAMEPDFWSVRLLRRSSVLNRHRCASVDIISAAIGLESSVEWLHIPEHSRAASHLASTEGGAGREITGAIRERSLVPVLSLDLIARTMRAPDVLKIDVDGGELSVLRGAETMILAKKPVILTEVYERNADAVTALLHQWGYHLYQYDTGEAGKRPISRAAYNTLAIPTSARSSAA